MLQNGGCNRKSTLLDLKDDDDFVLKFIPVNIRLSDVSLFHFFLFSDFTKKHNSFTVFKISLKILCYYYVDIIVIAGICQYLFSDH